MVRSVSYFVSRLQKNLFRRILISQLRLLLSCTAVICWLLSGHIFALSLWKNWIGDTRDWTRDLPLSSETLYNRLTLAWQYWLSTNINIISRHTTCSLMINTFWSCFRFVKLLRNAMKFQILLPISYLSTSATMKKLWKDDQIKRINLYSC